MTAGGTGPRRILDALEEQDRRLTSQTALMGSAAAAEVSRLSAQISGLGQEIASLDTQASAQQRLVQVAESEFNQLQNVATKGFISVASWKRAKSP